MSFLFLSKPHFLLFCLFLHHESCFREHEWRISYRSVSTLPEATPLKEEENLLLCKCVLCLSKCATVHSNCLSHQLSHLVPTNTRDELCWMQCRGVRGGGRGECGFVLASFWVWACLLCHRNSISKFKRVQWYCCPVMALQLMEVKRLLCDTFDKIRQSTAPLGYGLGKGKQNGLCTLLNWTHKKPPNLTSLQIRTSAHYSLKDKPEVGEDLYNTYTGQKICI